MKLSNLIQRFARDDSGAVTVDWVVLTAAIVGLAVAVPVVIRMAVADITADIEGQLQSQRIVAAF